MATEDSDSYPTPDTPLAAWLYCQGFPLLEVQRDYVPLKYGGKPTVFVFGKSDALDGCVRQWQVGEANGNCYLYEQARKKLLNMIHAPREEVKP